jgi:hypothetical protein
MNAIGSCFLRIQKKHIASIAEVTKPSYQNTSIHPGKIHHAFMKFLHTIGFLSAKDWPNRPPDTGIPVFRYFHPDISIKWQTINP